MPANDACVIVGAGLAGAKAAQALREEGLRRTAGSDRRRARAALRAATAVQGLPDGEETAVEQIYVHPPQWYAEHNVDMRLGMAVTAVDPAAREMTLDDGSRVRLRQAAADHRIRTAPPARSRARAWSGCSTCDGSRTATRSRKRSSPPHGQWSSARAGSAWRPLLRRVRPVWRSPCWRWPSCRCCGSSAARSLSFSRTCTATTVWICGSAHRSPRSPAAAARWTEYGCPTVPASTPTWSSSG
ncbi:hypothetical protein SAFG77S_09963 [Streptomyces afghaniensis]